MSNIYTTINTIDKIFEYNSIFKVLICKECKHCINNLELKSHIEKYHKFDYNAEELHNILFNINNFNIELNKNVQIPKFNKFNF